MKKIQIAPIVKSIDSLIDAIDILIMKADEDLEEELNEEGYVETKRAVEIVNELEEELTEAFNDDCDDLLEKLQDAVGLDDFIEKTWPKISSATDLRDAIYSIFQPLFLEMLEKSVTGFLAGDDPDLLEDGMEILSKPAKDFVENWSDELAGLMNLSTKEQIEGILLGGQKDHLSVMQVSQKISESSIRNPGYKARRAALTEVLRAESYGQLEAMKQNPAIAEKEWMHTGMHKNKPRPNHQAISGQKKKVDEPFDLTGADGSSYKPMCPRDTVLPAGETINCHCLMKSIRDPNWKKLSVEERRALREQYLKEADNEVSPSAYSTYMIGREKVKFDEQKEYTISLDSFDEKINEGLSKAAKKVAEYGSRDMVEYAALVDLTTGNEVFFDSDGDESSVRCFYDYIDKHNGCSVAMVHNHITESELSFPDIQVLANTEEINIVASVTNNGIINVVVSNGNKTTDYLPLLYDKENTEYLKSHPNYQQSMFQDVAERELYLRDLAVRDFVMNGVKWYGK